MFWDKVAVLYDFVERLLNGKVYRETGRAVAEHISSDDHVLECACGTGAISVCVAPVCARLTATDFSKGMLKRAARKAKRHPNMDVAFADITSLHFGDNRFDKVIAGNVIHLLDNPNGAIAELVRVCKPGGKIIIPTYINMTDGKSSKIASLFGKAGAGFKRQFDLESYKNFFIEAGYEDVTFRVLDGRMPCAIAVIKKN